MRTDRMVLKCYPSTTCPRRRIQHLLVLLNSVTKLLLADCHTFCYKCKGGSIRAKSRSSTRRSPSPPAVHSRPTKQELHATRLIIGSPHNLLSLVELPFGNG